MASEATVAIIPAACEAEESSRIDPAPRTGFQALSRSAGCFVSFSPAGSCNSSGKLLLLPFPKARNDTCASRRMVPGTPVPAGTRSPTALPHLARSFKAVQDRRSKLLHRRNGAFRGSRPLQSSSRRSRSWNRRSFHVRDSTRKNPPDRMRRRSRPRRGTVPRPGRRCRSGCPRCTAQPGRESIRVVSAVDADATVWVIASAATAVRPTGKDCVMRFNMAFICTPPCGAETTIRRPRDD